MRFLIAVDLEGVACAVAPPTGTVEDAPNITFIRRQATREANAAARELFAGGASRVIVWDCHGCGNSLAHDELDRRCEIALGATVESRFPGLEAGFSGVMMIGYHAMEGTPGATLAHSYSSVSYREIRVNGTAYGEIGIDAMIAGGFSVPVILLASDDKGVAEAQALLPWAETVATKRSLGFARILSRHPDAVISDIAEAAKRAVNRLPEMKPLVKEGPIELAIVYKTQRLAEQARLIDREGRPFASPDAYTRVGVVRDVASLVYYL